MKLVAVLTLITACVGTTQALVEVALWDQQFRKGTQLNVDADLNACYTLWQLDDHTWDNRVRSLRIENWNNIEIKCTFYNDAGCDSYALNYVRHSYVVNAAAAIGPGGLPGPTVRDADQIPATYDKQISSFKCYAN